MTAPPATSALHALVSVLGYEEALKSELGAAANGPRWPAVLSCRAPLPRRDPAFALQQIPQAHQIHGASVRALAEGADGWLAPRLAAHDGPFTVHAYVPDAQSYRTLIGRADLLGETWLGLLRERRRREHRRYQAPGVVASWGQTLLVQLALVGRTSLLVSAARPQPLPAGGFDLAPWPAGRAPVPEDRQAPSRAYRKLVEGFAWLGRGPRAGESCVDLGGAPGGWAFTALSAGAQVIAVDRSPLSPPALGHPRLSMVVGNAFGYRPAAPVDWLLCDVICQPDRTLALVDDWMKAGLCQNVVATLKFKGAADYPIVERARARLAAHRWDLLRFKHLAHHHNEVAILAARSAPRT